MIALLFGKGILGMAASARLSGENTSLITTDFQNSLSAASQSKVMVTYDPKFAHAQNRKSTTLGVLIGIEIVVVVGLCVNLISRR